MKGWKAMQNEKHLDSAVLIYLFLLLGLVVINLIDKIDLFDLVYFVVVLCCVFKYFIIIYDNRK